ncbi:MAG: flagellar protein FlgN [bacterium]
MTSSAKPATALGGILSRMLELMQELGEVMRSKQALLVASSTDGLAELSRREEELALRLSRLEQQRISLLARQHGLSVEDAAELPADELAAPEQETLYGFTGEMRGCIAELQDLQDDNRVLTQRLVDYGELVLKLVTQGEERPGYNSLGRPAEGSRRELLNCRV